MSFRIAKTALIAGLAVLLGCPAGAHAWQRNDQREALIALRNIRNWVQSQPLNFGASFQENTLYHFTNGEKVVGTEVSLEEIARLRRQLFEYVGSIGRDGAATELAKTFDTKTFTTDGTYLYRDGDQRLRYTMTGPDGGKVTREFFATRGTWTFLESERSNLVVLNHPDGKPSRDMARDVMQPFSLDRFHARFSLSKASDNLADIDMRSPRWADELPRSVLFGEHYIALPSTEQRYRVFIAVNSTQPEQGVEIVTAAETPDGQTAIDRHVFVNWREVPLASDRDMTTRFPVVYFIDSMIVNKVGISDADVLSGKTDALHGEVLQVQHVPDFRRFKLVDDKELFPTPGKDFTTFSPNPGDVAVELTQQEKMMPIARIERLPFGIKDPVRQARIRALQSRAALPMNSGMYLGASVFAAGLVLWTLLGIRRRQTT